MEGSKNDEVVIMGGGIAGLTFALEMTRRGRQVVVLESSSQVGGLARTLVRGDYRFDLGGHRFHCTCSDLSDWVRDLMDGDLITVPRRSRIRLDGRYVDYPLQFPNALQAFGLPTAVGILASYLRAPLRSGNNHTDVSFEDWVVRRFGRSLFNIYFRPYTEKVWGLDCGALSADWASQRIRLPSLASAIGSSLIGGKSAPPTLISRFLYPPLGIGMISDQLAHQILATGQAAIHLGSRVTGLTTGAGGDGWQVQFRQNGQERVVLGRQVISTIPLDALMQILPASGGRYPTPGCDLDYRGLICVLLAIDGDRLSSDTWTYFPDQSLVFGRTHEPPNWSSRMAPAGSTSLCVEIFATPGDDIWQRPDDELIHETCTDLDQIGMLPRARVRDAWSIRVPYAYPVYRVGYADELDRVRDYLARWPTLHLLGRTGSFRYLNIDGVIAQALQLAQELAAAP